MVTLSLSKYARFTRKTNVQKAEIVQTRSNEKRWSSNSVRFLIAFHTCFSAHRSRSVGAVFYHHFTDYELKIILLTTILKYSLSKKANPKAWFKTPSWSIYIRASRGYCLFSQTLLFLTKVRCFMLDCKNLLKYGLNFIYIEMKVFFLIIRFNPSCSFHF